MLLDSRNGEAQAYFYCQRNEEGRMDPENILRTILKQLSSSGTNAHIVPPVLTAYRQREQNGTLADLLRMSEIRHLLVEVTNTYPQSTIIIDALDEIDRSSRKHLLLTLKDIVQSSKNLVKIFVSSRNEHDILHHLALFSSVHIEATDNGPDIERFVNVEIQARINDGEFLLGEVSEDLKNHICRTLAEGANGMCVLPESPWYYDF